MPPSAVTMDARFVFACRTGQLSAVQDMVRGGVDINTVNSSGATGLWRAISSKHWAVVTWLLSHDTVNTNYKNSNGYTYLHMASYHGAPVSVINRLCDIMSSADINTVDSYGDTALDRAVRENHLDIVSCLGGREEVTWDMGRLEEVAR